MMHTRSSYEAARLCKLLCMMHSTYQAGTDQLQAECEAGSLAHLLGTKRLTENGAHAGNLFAFPPLPHHFSGVHWAFG
eukprot:1977952-Rhodomonas_salina.1